MPPPRLIVIYAGYGDAFLIEYDCPTSDKPDAKGYWLIDGGPVTGSAYYSKGSKSKPKSANTSKKSGDGESDENSDGSDQSIQSTINFEPGAHAYQAYYQFLKQTLLRYCRSNKDNKDAPVDLLKGITVTHPHADHMDGIIQLISDWLPDSGSPDPESARPNIANLNSGPNIKFHFDGPILVNGDFRDNKNVLHKGDGKSTSEIPRNAILWNLLEKKNFKSTLISAMDLEDESIPKAMSNVSMAGSIWKLYKPDVHDTETSAASKAGDTGVELGNTGSKGKSPSTDGSEAKVRGKGALKWSVDDSEMNINSIITTWDDENYQIVTTGDSIGSKILESVKGLNSDNGRSIGVFKVPHHGSRRNSQPNDHYEVKTTLSNAGEGHHLCFRFICWYLSEHVPSGASDEDRELIHQFRTNIEDDFAEQWNLEHPGPNTSFSLVMTKLALSFRQYFTVPDPSKSSESYRSYYISGQLQWTLDTDENLLRFWMLLVNRMDLLPDQLYMEPPDSTKLFKHEDVLNLLKPPLALKSYLDSPNYLNLYSSKGSNNSNKHKLKKTKKSGGLSISKEISKLLKTDPHSIIKFRLGIRGFYRKLRAKHYVISANGKFDHPSPETIAGIMAAAIERNVEAKKKDESTEKCRIFVTTGAAIQLEQIRTITNNLLKGHYKDPLEVPGEDTWSPWIDIYYLDKDYSGAIPTSDQSELEGWNKIDFNSSIQHQKQLQQLKKEFNRVSAYDIPRGNEPKESTFRLLTTNPDKMTFKIRRLDSEPLEPLEPRNPKRKIDDENVEEEEITIERREEDKPIVYLGSLKFKFGGPGSSFYISEEKDKKLKPNLEIEDQDYYQLSTLVENSPESITLKKMDSSLEEAGTKFIIMTKKRGKTLLYNDKEPGLVFDSRSGMNQARVVYVRAERMTGFGASSSTTTQLPFVSTLSTSAQEPSVETSSFAAPDSLLVNLFAAPPSEGLPNLTPVAEPDSEPALDEESVLEIEPDTEVEVPVARSRRHVNAASTSLPSHPSIPESTKSRKKISTEPSHLVNLRGIVDEVLGDLRSAAVFREISSVGPGFTLANVAEYQVDTENPRSADATESTYALILNPPLIFSNFAGLDQVNVQSALATISTHPPCLKLSLTMKRPKGALCSFTFEGDVPLLQYLQDIGYKGKPENLKVASLATSIVGPEVLWSFFSDLPSDFHSVISQLLRESSVNPLETKMDFESSPFGPTVTSASIMIEPLKGYEMKFGPIQVPIPVVTATLTIEREDYDTFNLALEFVVHIVSNNNKFPFSFSVTRDGLEPVVLDFVAGSKMSPSSILNLLGFNPSQSSITLPLGHQNQDLGIDLQNIGFTLSQPYAGSHGDLDLTSIYFSIGDSKSQDKTCLSPWQDLLPNSVLPEPSASTLTDWSLKTVILNPKSSLSDLSSSVGLQLDFGLNIRDDRSNIRFQVSHWPMKGLKGIFTTSVSFWDDEFSELQPPTITEILEKITDHSSKSLADSIPVLGPVLNETSITHGSLSVEDKKVSGFSLGAQTGKWQLLSEPLIEIDSARLTVDYNGHWWSGRLSTEIIFANKYHCTAEVILPSMNTTGGMSIRNESDEFTFDALAKAINPQADFEKVPIIGGKALASLRLEKASLEISRTEQSYSISAFEIGLGWNPEPKVKIGELETFGNHLSIGMYTAPSEDSFVTMAGTGTSDTGTTWFVRWEGGIFDNWHLTASLEYSNTEKERLVALSGVIFNPLGHVNPAGLIGAWSGSSPVDSNSLWGETIPQNVKQSFELQECRISAAIGSETRTFACSARATWGKDRQISGVLLIDKHSPPGSDPKWGFAFALDVRNFHFKDLAPNSPLAEQIDKVFHINQVSVLVFNNPGNMGLLRISELIGRASGSGLLPSETNFLPTKALDEATFDRRISDIQAGGLSTNKTPDIVHKAGLAILARFSFGSAEPGSLTGNLKSLAGPGLTEVDLMGYVGRLVQGKTAGEKPTEGDPAKPADEKSVIAFKASISDFKLLPSVEMKMIELTYALRLTTSGIITNGFSLTTECDINLENNLIWTIKANLVITEHNAILTTDLSKKLIQLLPKSELPKFELSNIRFTVTYTFGGKDDASNSGVVRLESPGLSSIDLALSGDVTLGSLEAKVSAIFDSQRPGALVFERHDSWSISTLFNGVFGVTLPNELLDIKFSDFIMYYAWADMKKSSGKIESFKKGFHAKSNLDLFGITFSLSIDINRGDEEKRGIIITGEKKGQVKVLALTLNEPKFEFSTDPQVCKISTGVALFDQDFPNVSVAYKFKESRFLGTVTIPENIPFLGGAKVEFELRNEGKKNVLRIASFPAVFSDLIRPNEILNKVRDMNKDPCEVFLDEFKQFLTTKFHINLGIPDGHEGLAPETGDEDARELKLQLSPSLEVQVTIAGKSIATDTISFGPWPLTIPVPDGLSLNSFASSLFTILTNNIPTILDKLFEKDANIEKVAKLLTIIVAEKAGKRALSKLMCRKNNSEPENPEDPSKPDEQDPVDDPMEPEDMLPGSDGGGPLSIYTGPLSGLLSGISLFGGLGGLIVIGGIAALVVAGKIVGKVLNWLLKRNRKSPPSKPRDKPDEPPLGTDPFSRLLRSALSPEDKFTRWEKCTTHPEALEAATDCSLEYYAAIRILGETLGKGGVPKQLGNKTFKYYRYRYHLLRYDLSTLGQRFADKWLKKPDGSITFTPRSTPKNLILDISWKSLKLEELVGAIVAVTVNDEEQTPQAFDASVKTTTITVPSSGVNPKITVKVAPFCAMKSKDSSSHGIENERDFVFFSMGEPADASISLEKAGILGGMPLYLTHLDAGPWSKLQPPFADLSYSASVTDLKNYPVLVVGSLTWWPIRYSDSGEGLTLLGHNKSQEIKRDLTDSQAESGQIGSLRVKVSEESGKIERSVEVCDTAGKRLTYFGFSLFPVIGEPIVEG